MQYANNYLFIMCVFIQTYIWRWFDKCQLNHSVENYGKRIVAKWTIERKMDATNMAHVWRTSKEFPIYDYAVVECVDFQQFCYSNDPSIWIFVVIYGVCFRVVNSHLRLEGQFTNFNYQTGQLVDIQHSEWITMIQWLPPRFN